MHFGLGPVALAVLLLHVSPASADYDAAVQAQARDDLKTALSEARKGADAGDPRAQRLYGQLLLKDSGARAEPREGIRWLTAAADAGDVIARRDLANAYQSGTGVPKNPKEAASWFRKAAEKGDSISQYALAVLLRDGTSVAKDEAESARWMRAAADQGDPNAQLALGGYYQKGVGLTKDLLQAYVWVSLAAKYRDPRASQMKREIAVELSSDQRREGDRLVASWGSARVAARVVEASAKPTGTGFIISGDGHIVTNDHVVRNCKGLRIRRLDESVGTATLVAQSMDEDLALLKADFRPEAVAPFRPGRDLGQGETVVAFGFPLSGVLASSSNVASGKVTALVGIDNDERFLQMSAQLRPGNSGGPLLDMNSRVVGIITTPADTPKTDQATGRNAGTAVKGDAAAAFLQKQGVAVSITGGSPRTLNPAEVGDRAKRFTVRIECLT